MLLCCDWSILFETLSHARGNSTFFFIQFHGLFLNPGRISRAASAPVTVKDDENANLHVQYFGYPVSIVWRSCVHLRSEPGIYFLLFNMAAVRSSYAYSVFARIIRRELPATFLHEDDQVV